MIINLVNFIDSTITSFLGEVAQLVHQTCKTQWKALLYKSKDT